jgi:glyoxylase-like metal-dependent hydrolase (beta-lactamase superfamily II)
MNYKIIRNGSCKVNRKLLNKSEKMGTIDVPANIIQIEYRNYNIIIDAGYGQNALKVTKKFPERFMRWLTPLTPGAIDVNTLAIEGKKNILIYSHYHIDHVGNFNYDKKIVCYGSKLELETILN